MCTWILAAAAPALADDGGESGVTTTTRIVVIVVTILAFVAAALAGRRALRAPVTHIVSLSDEWADVELLASGPSSAIEPKPVRLFEKVFLVMLLLYAMLDRGFAWVHVPGTPLFVGELTLVLGLVAVMSSRVSVIAAIRRSPALKALTAWMVWGFLFLVLQISTYGINTIRDSALWYYGSAALLVVFLLVSDPSRLGRWADLFGKAIPYVLLWFPVAMAMDTLFGSTRPYVPDSVVPMFDHRFGNIAVLSAISLGFIWLVDRERGRFTTGQRIGYTSLAAIVILLAGFQNRGGLVAASLGIILILILLRRRRGELVLAIGTVAITLASVAIVSNISIPISNGREISAAQMMDNIGSVVNPGSGGERQTNTTQWRLNLWTRVLDDVITESPLAGFGPGPDIGARYGVTTNANVPLRNPHNSHLGILARMGLVGIGMWVILWSAWAFHLMQLRSVLKRRGRTVESGLIAWLLVSVLVILVNAIFDPTVEGPQVGFWLWMFFGVGSAVPLIYAGAAGKPKDAQAQSKGDTVTGSVSTGSTSS